MVYGYNGQILRVDLSKHTVEVDKPDENFYRQYIGGRGFIAYFLLRELPASRGDALVSENKLIFATGPLTGTAVAGAGRNSVGAKSPLTNGYGDAEVGGYWGSELKHAGFDAIIIQGKSDTPVYIWIEDGKVEIRDARYLWGKTTGECERLIQEELGDKSIRVAQIGIAGENQVRYACIANDLSHVAGRTGMGAVMGSKKLKAIAVRGRRQVDLSNPTEFRASSRRLSESLKTHPYAVALSKIGTAGAVMAFNTAGALPTHNFREGIFEGANRISAAAISERMLVKRSGCYACPIRCKPVVSVGQPYNVDPAYGGPEYETLASLGSNCGIDNLEAIAKGNQMCNAFGLDTISTGDAIAFAMECFEEGIVSEKDVGFRINFGNARGMLQLVNMIAKREGFGAILAEGVARAASRFGKKAESFAMHVKGQEIPMHDPRFKPGMGVGYAISPTGADHEHNIHDTMYAVRIPSVIRALGVLEPVPRESLNADKVRLLFYGSLWQHTLDCLVFCHFVPLGPVQAAELIREGTGWNMSVWELMKVGERCTAMTRAFNMREGRVSSDDCLPPRFFSPLPSGPLKGVKLSEVAFKNALDTYYSMMGWDNNNTAPKLAKLQELGIEWVSKIQDAIPLVGHNMEV